jgi:hypothetical protein
MAGFLLAELVALLASTPRISESPVPSMGEADTEEIAHVCVRACVQEKGIRTHYTGRQTDR